MLSIKGAAGSSIPQDNTLQSIYTQTQYTAHRIQFTQNTTQNTLHTTHYTLHYIQTSTQCTEAWNTTALCSSFPFLSLDTQWLYTVHCTPYTVHCTLYACTVHCTMHNAQRLSLTLTCWELTSPLHPPPPPSLVASPVQWAARGQATALPPPVTTTLFTITTSLTVTTMLPPGIRTP